MTETFENYLVRRISAHESYQDLLRFPRYFEIETINACNARCPMCTIDQWDRQAPSMKDALFAKIADELCANADTVKRVSLYRNGEPLLDKKLASRVACLKAGGIGQVAISTNVSLLTADRAKDLLEAGLDLVLLSIDSLNKEVFEKIRVRLVHEEVMENARRFIELRDRIRPQTQIWIRMIRQEENHDEWPVFEQYWRSLLAPHDRVNFHNLHNWGGQLKNFKPVVDSYEPTLPCIALWSLMIIFANGDVPLCNVNYDDKWLVGQLRDHSIADVWRSEAMNGYRRLHLAGDKAKIPLCLECNVWDEPPDREKVAPQFGEAVTVAAITSG